MKRGAIFYTNNLIPQEIIRASLASIATEELYICENNYDPNTIHNPIRNAGHISLFFQIQTALIKAKLSGVGIVSFLEHDVIYPKDYFDYPDFPGNVIANSNYIGVCKDGFQSRPGIDPLHQLTMKMGYALEYATNKLKESLTEDIIYCEPDCEYDHYRTDTPAVHINWGGNFTSHYETFGNEYWQVDEKLGDYKNIIDMKIYK